MKKEIEAMKKSLIDLEYHLEDKENQLDQAFKENEKMDEIVFKKRIMELIIF